jgi:hypothetical protein
MSSKNWPELLGFGDSRLGGVRGEVRFEEVVTEVVLSYQNLRWPGGRQVGTVLPIAGNGPQESR